MATKKKYQISFHTEKKRKKEISVSNLSEKDLKEILFANVNPQEEEFNIYDYNSSLTINALKEYFLLTFGNKYKYCPCVLFVYYLETSIFELDKLILLDKKDNRKLSEFKYSHLYIIKRDFICDCEMKEYQKYMYMQKTDIIKELTDLKKEYSKLENVEKQNKDLIKKLEELEKENNFLMKTEELKVFKNLVLENFYDIIIKIDSIRDLNKKGWVIKMNENGTQQYKNHKDKEYLTIGVIGNANRGKSFLLSKISKIDLATGYSIQTEGLSIKYPDLKDYKDRNLILLDSAGLETPVFKTKIDEKDKEVKDKEVEEKDKEIEEKDKEIEEKKNENIREKNSKDEIDKKDQEQNKEFKENARDKIMTELFLQNFIIRSSDILILVVGQLTYSEQLLVNKIKHEGKRLKKDRIFIVHNLQEFAIIDEVENYITNILLKCSTFNLKKNKIVNIKKNDEDKDQKDEIKEEENKNEIKEEENKDEIINEINNEENKNEIKNQENENEENKFEVNNEINNEDKKNEIKDEKPKEKNRSIEQEEVKDESNFNNIHFYEVLYYDENRKIDIYHLILAKENSEAGKAFNDYSYKFIENIYNTVTEKKKFDIFEEVKIKFKDLSGTILNNNVTESNFSSSDETMENKIIKLNLKEELSLKKCYMDELGFSFFKTGDFEPKYNYFKPNENTLEIRLEIPGNTKCTSKHIVEGEETKIIVSGVKNHDATPKKFEDNIFNIREFSKFEVVIPLKVEKFKITSTDPKEGYPIIKNGVFVVQYELAQEGKEAQAEAEGL